MNKVKKAAAGYKGNKKAPKTRKPRTAPQRNAEELYDVKAKEIKMIMKWYGLTQVEIATELNKKPQSISKILSAVDVPVRVIKCIIELIGEDEYRVLLAKVKQGKKPAFAITNR